MQPVLNLWRMGQPRPTAWPGEVMVLDPWVAPAGLMARIASWVQANPLGWLVASGPAVALLIRVAADRLDLRIAGAALVAPQDWHSLHGLLPLAEPPMPFPTVLFPQDASGQTASLRERRLAQAWQSRLAGALPASGPLSARVMQEIMADRLLRLGQTSQAAASDGSAMKAVSDFESRTAAIASRTSSIVRRTAQVVSSGQSVQGT